MLGKWLQLEVGSGSGSGSIRMHLLAPIEGASHWQHLATQPLRVFNVLVAPVSEIRNRASAAGTHLIIYCKY